MEKGSLGLIETWGYVPAIEAADAGSKAANVTLLGYEEVRAGLVTVKFVGDVAAVRAAVTAGSAVARKVGKVVSVHVIPRPDRKLRITPGGPPTPGEKRPDPPPPSPPGEEGAEPTPIPSEPAEGPEDELPPGPPTTPVKGKARGGKIKKKH